MGLDMYLYLRKHKYTFEKDKGFYPEELKEFLDEQANRNYLSKATDYQIGYWRKANAIHKFFVDYSGREDDCSPIYVSENALKDLKEKCENALKNRDNASDILPTEEGFFFGSTEYDDWYFDDLEYTVKLLDKVLKFIENNPDYDVIYRASW